MSRSTADWDLLSPLLLRLYSEIDVERHSRVMLDILNELVPADSIVLNLFEVATARYSVMTLPDGIAKPHEVELVGRYLGQSPFPPYFVATGDSQWKMTTDFMPVEDFHATTLHREGLSRWGINQQICGMLAFFNGTAHALTVNRTHRGFSEDERALLNAIHPHLVTSYLNAQAFHEKHTDLQELRTVLEAAPGAYGYILDDGRLSWLQPQARAWLGEHFHGEAVDADGLPSAVRHLMDQAVARRPSPPAHLRHVTESSRLLVCLLPSQLGGWILRLERSEIHPHLQMKPLPTLSKRENEVLEWMIHGKRNGEIATILGISSRTVEKHVESILRVLEVENRATAIVRAMELCASPVP